MVKSEVRAMAASSCSICPGEVQALEITAPDDLHLHVRDGNMLKAVLPHTTRIFRRCDGCTA